MQQNLSLDDETGTSMQEEEDRGALRALEEKISALLARYHDLKHERDELLAALRQERERREAIQRTLEALSQDKEQVKTRIDQLLHRLKGMDL